MSIVALADADPSCGRKAYRLGVALRAGLPVPDGFVVTGPAVEPQRIAEQLDRLGGGAVAVRSSGLAEDTSTVSFAGQLETILGARSLDEILVAVRRCAASPGTERARSYRARLDPGGDGPAAAPVLVQTLVAADHAGVLFTRDPRTGADVVLINASWGLGESVVSGAVTPDEVVVAPPGDVVRLTVGTKQTRLDLRGHGLVRSPVAEADRARSCVPPDGVARLVALGRRAEGLFGTAQDVEWAVADGRVWLVQARPVTTRGGPAPATDPAVAVPLVTGVPSSPGRARGPARLVRSVEDFRRVRPGDVLVCRTTDPAWTPLFGLAAAVVTETGGILSHAAIVAREFGIPAVVGVDRAMTALTDGDPVTVDGTHGTISGGHHR
ncbi:pyruvate, phosphate dikinase [Micromonospora sp. HM134]|uniref:PEP/pyruvate-binding domain-containing protein n=1 Tax=Micromonospora sp. HM134 TaxID=2583243 RepID=UPI0011988CC9|nr:PEP/pyruvate-binding domain-containing protein [Micromonospora sp. HM134]QDY09364.1 pyruvate, phosphate dikinase [Micromonospora sp. HM134]